MLRASSDEVQKAGTTVELCQEESSIALGFGASDPLEAGAKGASFVAAFSEDSAPIATHPHCCCCLLIRERKWVWEIYVEGSCIYSDERSDIK